MSNELTVTYEQSWHAVGHKMPADCTVAMDAPGTCSGGAEGESFSPIDLFAVAYAGCVIMSMDLAARKNGFHVAGSKVRLSVAVVKDSAPRIEGIDVTVVLPRQYTYERMDVLRGAAHYCPIHSALRPEVATTLTFEVA